MSPSELDRKLKDIDSNLQLNTYDDTPAEIVYKTSDGKTIRTYDFLNNTYFSDNEFCLSQTKLHKLYALVLRYRYPEEFTDNPFKQYTDHLADVLQQKNQAYGDSFAKSVNDYGLPVIGIRLSDKYNRIHHLITNSEMKENDESLKDTLLDMAGYSILALKYLDNINATRIYGSDGKPVDMVKNND